MRRALKFLVIAAIALLIAWWVGTLPGDFVMHSGAYTITTSFSAGVVLIFLAALLVVVLLRVLGGIFRVPGSVGAWRGGRRQKLGELATQRGLVALAAGDAAAARAEAGRAAKLLGDAPLVMLLAAEAARLSGDAAAAQAAFAKLTKHKELAFLGHRGLLRASLAAGDHDAAAEHALSAEDAYPGSQWLRTKRLALAVRQKHFGAAMLMAREPAQIAALATGAAQAASDKVAALKFAKRAVKTAPDLAPAVVTYAQILRGLGKPKAAAKALLAGWRAAPHPLLAEAYLAGSPTPLARAQAAQTLAAANPGHKESEILLAETAAAAALPGEAARHANAAMLAGADDPRAPNVLAGLEGKQATPRSSAWVCSACHLAEPAWTPACVHCHALGSLVWKA
jgi:HemY protein